VLKQTALFLAAAFLATAVPAYADSSTSLLKRGAKVYLGTQVSLDGKKQFSPCKGKAFDILADDKIVDAGGQQCSSALQINVLRDDGSLDTARLSKVTKTLNDLNTAAKIRT